MTGTTAQPLHGRPVPDDAVLDLLRRWMPHQRWFPGKGTNQRLERVGVIDLPDPLGEAQVQVHLLRLSSGPLLQVPVVLRDDGAERPGRIGTVAGSAVVDGSHDPAFVRAWLAEASWDGPVAAHPGHAEGMHVLAGEQSNTSVLLPRARPPGILKVFRGITVGPNPDVEVPLALSRAGWDGVPRPLAWLAGSWGGEHEVEVGHLGVLSELVVGAHDGFDLACRHAREGHDFGDLAEDLGRTTAQMHAALRTALPLPDDGSGSPAGHAAGVVRTLRERAAAAAAAAPVLTDRVRSVDRVLDGVGQLEWLPPLQRVHGDYHLGQVLRSGDGQWYVLDFEGEPQAAPEEKTRPDLALRDLAGMLRSIDYAAAVGRATDPSWAASARERLVKGYVAAAGPEATGAGTDVLLCALELDKALYEVVYESRNRPTWLAIPLEGVDRLLDRGR